MSLSAGPERIFVRRVACIALAAVALMLTGRERAHAAPSVPAGREPTGTVSSKPPAGQRLRVFYSGHSLLDNPLPDWTELIAVSRGDSLGWQEQIVIGSPIRVRTKGDDAKAAGFPGYQLGKSKGGGKIDVLRELQAPTALAHGEKYERLVITERNDLLGTIQWEGTIGYLRHFHDRIVEHGEQGRSLLYQVWPDIDKKNAAAWLAYVEQELFVWECVAARVNQSLAAERRGDRVDVIPGGLALRELVRRALAGEVPGVTGTPRARLDAIFGDEVHLQPLGVYLLAAVHYAVLFGKTPVGGAAPREVDRATVPLLQRIAWETVEGYRSRSAASPTLTECRSRIASDVCPAYQRLRGRPEKVTQCTAWASPQGPLADARTAQTRTAQTRTAQTRSRSSSSPRRGSSSAALGRRMATALVSTASAASNSSAMSPRWASPAPRVAPPPGWGASFPAPASASVASKRRPR
jgi:hypothetical protein